MRTFFFGRAIVFELDNVARCRRLLVSLLGPGCQPLIYKKRVYYGLFMLGRAIVF